MPSDIANGAECRASDLPCTLRNGVGHAKDLAGVLIEQRMIITERASDVPVKILRFNVQTEHVRQEFSQGVGDLGYRFGD